MFSGCTGNRITIRKKQLGLPWDGKKKRTNFSSKNVIWECKLLNNEYIRRMVFATLQISEGGDRRNCIEDGRLVNELFPEWKRNTVNIVNSGILINQFKDPAPHMCLAGAVVAPWSLTQEVAGSNPFTVMTNIFSHSIQRIQWKHLGKTQS